jgi:hypothetical protein
MLAHSAYSPVVSMQDGNRGRNLLQVDNFSGAFQGMLSTSSGRK